MWGELAVRGSQRPGRKTHPGSQRVWRGGKQQIIPRQEKGRACLPHSALGSPNKTSSERLVSRTRPWPVALRYHEGQHGNCWQHLLGKDPLRRVKIKVLFFINEDERSQTAVEIGWSTLSVHREGQQLARGHTARLIFTRPVHYSSTSSRCPASNLPASFRSFISTAHATALRCR